MFKAGDLLFCNDANAERNYDALLVEGNVYQVIEHPENSATKVWIKSLKSPLSSNQYARPSSFTLVGTTVRYTGAMKVPKTKRGVTKKGYMPVYASSLGKAARLVGGFIFKSEEEAQQAVQKHASLVNVVAVEILVPPLEEQDADTKAATALL